ncbi:MAG: metallophosphoesterase [Spirochaetales bacterium]|nr:metallophosphoesterase [Spirochaetales bacterium]
MVTNNTVNDKSIIDLKNRLIQIYRRKSTPNHDKYLKVLNRANLICEHEDEIMRPVDSLNKSGGLVYLKTNIPTIIIPDLHARMDFILTVMLTEDEQGVSNMEKVAQDILQIVCVGDGFHSERRGLQRWLLALEEFRQEYRHHRYMDEEMRECLGLMEMVMEIKTAFPRNFHFLKGNHENITNERGNGNYPFRKFALEGAMVYDYVQKFYGPKFIQTYSTFEKNLPLLAVGRNFLVSHSEPATLFTREQVIEYRSNPLVIEGFTWTDNNAAEFGSVEKMLETYIENSDQKICYYFGGHRPISGSYNLRAGGRYVQIHNPDKFSIAWIREDGDIDLDTDIMVLENKVDDLVK